ARVILHAVAGRGIHGSRVRWFGLTDPCSLTSVSCHVGAGFEPARNNHDSGAAIVSGKNPVAVPCAAKIALSKIKGKVVRKRAGTREVLWCLRKGGCCAAEEGAA